jgi:hypothetical protein
MTEDFKKTHAANAKSTQSAEQPATSMV